MFASDRSFSPALLAPLLLIATSLLMFGSGCWRRSTGPEVVVYSAVDSETAQPILDSFAESTGVEVLPKFDIESSKTVGLAEELIKEGKRPRCDVFWNNEILHTLRLAHLGLLEPYDPPAAQDFPSAYRSADGLWHGFAARARVLLVNTNVDKADRPSSMDDLADPVRQWRVGMAKPLFGTTATHMACLYAAWGPAHARVYFDRLAETAVIFGGNKQVAEAVSAGQIDYGLTDTDDAMIEIERGMPVEIVYLDQEEGQLGTLFIPNTVALIKHGPNPEHGRQLIDNLLSPETEARLATGPSAQIPLNPSVHVKPRVETPATVRAMEADFEGASQLWPEVYEYLRGRF